MESYQDDPDWEEYDKQDEKIELPESDDTRIVRLF